MWVHINNAVLEGAQEDEEMDTVDARRLVDTWSNYVTSAWYFGADYNADNERNVRVALRRHIEAFVPDCDHAEVFLGEKKEPSVVAFDGKGLYRVQATAFEDGEEPVFSVEHYPLTTGAVTLTSTYEYGHGTAWRRVAWSFRVTDNHTVVLGTATGVHGPPDADELLCRAVAARLGYEVPPEADADQQGLHAA